MMRPVLNPSRVSLNMLQRTPYVARRAAAVFTILCSVSFSSLSAADEDELAVLLIDGQNNHDWRSTTPVLVETLEDAGIFTVEVVTVERPAEFQVDFSKYAVVVSNYNGPDWPEGTREAFVEYVRGGGGLVSVHAADNSFPGWKEYNEMIGLGGWGGRSEKDGPYVYYKDDELVRDDAPGGGGSHGAQHEFQVVVRAPEHPIVAGLPARWMHARDELYDRLRGPAENMTVLATAFAAKETGGTGHDEPSLMAIEYGKGRVFHTTQGHAVEAMRCAGFVFTLQRGAEWAATGKVTLKDVPSCFPTADAVREWVSPRALEEAFNAIRSYDFGGDRRPLTTIEESLRGAAPDVLRRAEKRLIAVLADPEATYAGKQFCVRTLRWIGTAACVPALAALLDDERLAHSARFALEGLPAPEATAALLAALESAEGDMALGLIGSLGARGDRSAVPALAPRLQTEMREDETYAAIVSATVHALGRLGGVEAVKALEGRQQFAQEIGAVRDDALLACAESFAAAGHRDEALAIYGKLRAAPVQRTVAISLAIERGMALLEGASAVPRLVERLDYGVIEHRRGIAALLRTVGGEDFSSALAETLGELYPRQAVVVIEALAARGDAVAAPAVLAATRSPEAGVRRAAIAALGMIGGAAAVAPLASIASEGSDAGETARRSLAVVRGDGVVDALLALIESSNESLRAIAIAALHERHETRALAALLSASSDESAAVRAAAFEAIGALGGVGELEPLVDKLVSAEADRASALAALRGIAERVDEKESATGVLASAISSGDAKTKAALLPLLAVLSTDAGLEAVRAALESEDASVASAALEALAAWQSSAPLEDLLALIKSTDSAEQRQTAVAGYLRQLSYPTERSPVETVKLLAEALELAGSDELEARRRIVAQLAKFPCKEGLALAESLTGDPDLAREAREAAASVRGALIAGSLVATASHRSEQTRNAFDDDPNTRWTTNTPMRPGMWFQIDLGEEQAVRRLVLDSRNSPGDYPRGCEVYVSADGEGWGEPVLTSPPQRPITRLQLEKSARGRFVRIVQTGETQGLFWSIHELRIDFE